jgi:arylsulfatase A-like enzyme
MYRRDFIKMAGITAGSFLVGGCSALNASASRKKQPNVLFIAIDDMNDWTTLFDKNNPIKTPNLERLAKRGMFFSRAYCAAPACLPSRTAIMSGYRPSTSGIYTNRDNPWPERAVTLSQYFRDNGYLAKGAGKIFHHPFNGGRGPEDQGWDDFQKWLPTRKPETNYNGYKKGMPGIGMLHSVIYDWGMHRQKMVDEDMFEYVSSVMEEDYDKPLFLAAGIFKPHLPFYAPPEFFKQYPFEETKLPEMKTNDLDDVPPPGIEMAHNQHFIYENVMQKSDADPGSYKKMVQCYQASATYADSIVGRLLDKLDATGRADNTIIILWSDNGYHLGDKESCVKFTLWEKANHIPFIIVAPGVTRPGSRCDRPVGLVDIYPTLLELAGLPPKDGLDGKSLVPLLKKPQQKWKPAIMTQGKGNHAIRSDRWRYIRYNDGSEELYDHDKDPYEWTNLAASPIYSNVIKEHRLYLQEYLGQDEK